MLPMESAGRPCGNEETKRLQGIGLDARGRVVALGQKDGLQGVKDSLGMRGLEELPTSHSGLET